MNTKKIMITLVLVLSLFMLYYFVGCQSTAKTSAKVYLQQNNVEKAIAQLEIDVQQNPQDAESHYLLGKCYGQKGHFEKMLKEFETSLAISDQCKSDIEKDKRKHWFTNFDQGTRKLQAEQYVEAVPDLKTAIAILPSEVNAYKNLTIAYAKLDSVEKVEVLYRRILELEPEDVQVLISLGILHHRNENYEDAISAFEKVLQLDSNNKDAIYYAALCYDLKGESDKALKMYDQSLQADPDEKDLYFNRGLLYSLRKENYEKAIEDFQKVLELDSTDFGALYNLGRAYLLQGDKFFKQRYDLEEKERSADKAKIEELREIEHTLYRNSLKYMLKAVEIEPDNPDFWHDIGVAYVRIGERKKGEEAFGKEEELNK